MLILVFLFSSLSIAQETEPCIQLGGKIKVTTRLSGEKAGEEEKLCVFGQTMILNKTARAEFWKEHTSAIDQLMISDYNKNKKKLKKMKFNAMDKEIDAIKSCRIHGGTTLELKSFTGEHTICRFSDYSGIEVNALFRGMADQSNKKALSIRNKKPRKN